MILTNYLFRYIYVIKIVIVLTLIFGVDLKSYFIQIL